MADQKEAEYRVRTRRSTTAGRKSDIVMAWGRDRETGRPRHILELTPAENGNDCSCDCAGCGLPLQAVNAGRIEYRLRPHFRHAAGVERNTCLIAAARAAILLSLPEDGYVTLPGHRRDAQIVGISGRVYDGWSEVPPELAKISSTTIVDEITAVVRLDDDREFRVKLVATRKNTTPDGGPIIEVVVSDPALSALSPDELRERMRLELRNANWCGHWKEDECAAAAEKDAIARAVDAIDYGSASTESALHKATKEILQQECSLVVPALRRSDGLQVRPHASLALKNVCLERPLGTIRPDVMARTVEQPGWPAEDLLVEVTVTNGIGWEREARIRARNVAALEIDLSRLAGRLNMKQFRDLIAGELVGKRWVYHPALDASEKLLKEAEAERRRKALDALRDAEPGARRPGDLSSAPTARLSLRNPHPSRKSTEKLGLEEGTYITVPDLRTRTPVVRGLNERHVIRRACDLRIKSVTTAASSDEDRPALRLETFATENWPAGTMFVELASRERERDPNRRKRVQERGHPTLVILVSAVDLAMSDESRLKDLVFSERASREWAFHPAIEEFMRRFEKVTHFQRQGFGEVDQRRDQ